ncbi:MAG TPA: eL32 family ribosomal protein, partial [Methanolinea sp.]|nr:eL32 family ribosomal protein [Methanolinea sp.]
VHTPDEIEGLDPALDAVRIAAAVGARKRGFIQEKAMAAGLKVLNPKDLSKKKGAPVEEEPEADEEVEEND